MADITFPFDVDDLEEPTRYVPAIVVETIERVVWVDEDEAADIERGDDLWALAVQYLADAKDEEPSDAGLTIRLADRWYLLPELVLGPVEACPHCAAKAYRPDDPPHYIPHATGCPLRSHHVGANRDYDPRPAASTWYADCLCGWEGPKRAEELEPGKHHLSHEFVRQLELDGREHLAGKPHGGQVNKPTGLPDMPAEHACWRPVPRTVITHLIPASAVSHG